MTQPKRSTSSRSTGARRATGAKKPAASKSTARKPASRTTTRKTTARKTTARKPAATSAGARARDAEQRAEANIRRLNDQIIESGKEVGTAALDAYESALKAIASSLDRGSKRSESETASSVLRSVADFVDEVRKSVVPAARKRLK